MRRMNLVFAQFFERIETHREQHVPTARTVQHVAADFEISQRGNTRGQGARHPEELVDMRIARSFRVLDEHEMSQHADALRTGFDTCAPAGMSDAAVLSFSAAKPAATL